MNAARTRFRDARRNRIGDAMRFATAYAFDDIERDRKTLVVISDGGDYKSDPAGAAREARRRGMRVVAIGVGDPDKDALVPTSMSDPTPVTYQGRLVATHLDGATMGAIGEYVPAGVGPLDLADVYRRLLAPGSGHSKRPADDGGLVWAACLALAILLLAVEFRVPERRVAQAGVLALAVLAMPVASFAQTVSSGSAKAVKRRSKKSSIRTPFAISPMPRAGRRKCPKFDSISARPSTDSNRMPKLQDRSRWRRTLPGISN